MCLESKVSKFLDFFRADVFLGNFGIYKLQTYLLGCY